MKKLEIKLILALFIVVVGMFSIIFIDLKETTQNSIVNLMIMVVGFYFGSSSGSEDKTKLLNEKE